MYIPQDPDMLLSFVNMKLRDQYDSLQELCSDNDLDINEIVSKLKSVGFEYQSDTNNFI